MRARSGDRLAQRELYLRHVRPVASRVARLLGHRGEAEDVVQDAFFEAFRDLHTLREPAHFEAWLMQIAVHQVRRRLRRRRLLARLGLLGDSEPDAHLEKLAAKGTDPETAMRLRKLDSALSSLATDLRLAWMLRMVEGCELADVARLTGCSLATAKRKITAAREHLAHHVDLVLLGEVDR